MKHQSMIKKTAIQFLLLILGSISFSCTQITAYRLAIESEEAPVVYDCLRWPNFPFQEVSQLKSSTDQTSTFEFGRHGWLPVPDRIRIEFSESSHLLLPKKMEGAMHFCCECGQWKVKYSWEEMGIDSDLYYQSGDLRFDPDSSDEMDTVNLVLTSSMVRALKEHICAHEVEGVGGQ
jgi:hypothetical protein